jgi:hypothetical protein
MKLLSHLSSQDGAGRVQLEGFGPTRNRKIVGSNPSSGSKTAAQKPFLALLAAQRQQAVIPLVGSSRRTCARPASLGRSPSGRSRAHRWPPSPVHDGRNRGRRTIQPALRAACAFAE